MIVLGLTGSIGMGKSTTAGLFAEAGAAVWDADAAVHRLYAAGGTAVPLIAALVPDAIECGAVDRDRLRDSIMGDPELLAKLEAIVHPLVRADRESFLRDAAARGCSVAVCDIPLLLESRDRGSFDAIIVVSAAETVQRARVLARPGMTEQTLTRILARQMPDADKRALADHIVDTGSGIESARAQVMQIMADVQGRQGDA